MIKTKNALKLPSGFIIAFFQELSAIGCRIFQGSRGGYQIKLHLRGKLSHTKRYVIAGNHQSLIDPFVIFALMPFRQRMRLLPLKFMTIPKVYHRWYVKPFAYLLGCFPAHIKERNHHTYGVEGAIKLIKYGYNICIFPEGHRVLQSESQPRPGIVRILEACPEAELLLAHLEWYYTKRGGKHVKLVLAPAPTDLDKTDPKAIMDAIYRL